MSSKKSKRNESFGAYKPKPFFGGDEPGNYWRESPSITHKQLGAMNIVENALEALHKQQSRDKRLYTINEVARCLNISKGTVINLLRSGQLTGIKTSEAENSPYQITHSSIITHILRVNKQ